MPADNENSDQQEEQRRKSEEVEAQSNARGAAEDVEAVDVEIEEGKGDGVDEMEEGEGEQDELELQEQVAALEAELEAEKDRRLRAQAELANFRKRIARQHAREMKYANDQLLTDLVSVLDNFESAVEAAEGSEDGESLLKGYEMILEQLKNVVGEHGLQEIEVEVGQQFDPMKHEAVDCIVTEEYEENAVVVVQRKGHKYHDRILRPPQVLVAVSPEMAELREQTEDEAGDDGG